MPASGSLPNVGSATGFIGRVGLANTNAVTYVTDSKLNQPLNRIRRILNKSHGSRKLKAMILAITGAAAGQSKAYSNYRVSAERTAGQAGVNKLGGARTVELVAYQTGNSVAGDITTFDAQITYSNKPTYPTVKGGGGGGRLGKLS